MGRGGQQREVGKHGSGKAQWGHLQMFAPNECPVGLWASRMQATGPDPEPTHPVFTPGPACGYKLPKNPVPAHNLEPMLAQKGDMLCGWRAHHQITTKTAPTGDWRGAGFMLLWSASAPGGDPTSSPPPGEELEMFPAPSVRCRPGSSFP